jgi:hypothetical protein
VRFRVEPFINYAISLMFISCFYTMKFTRFFPTHFKFIFKEFIQYFKYFSRDVTMHVSVCRLTWMIFRIHNRKIKIKYPELVKRNVNRMKMNWELCWNMLLLDITLSISHQTHSLFKVKISQLVRQAGSQSIFYTYNLCLLRISCLHLNDGSKTYLSRAMLSFFLACFSSPSIHKHINLFTLRPWKRKQEVFVIFQQDL